MENTNKIIQNRIKVLEIKIKKIREERPDIFELKKINLKLIIKKNTKLKSFKKEIGIVKYYLEGNFF